MKSKEILELIDAYLWEIQEGKDAPSAEDILLDLKTHIKENSLIDIEMNKQGPVKISDLIQRDLEVLECFKKYFNFELVFENNQTYLVFKSKERYLPVDDKLSVANKYYEPLKEWLKNDK